MLCGFHIVYNKCILLLVYHIFSLVLLCRIFVSIIILISGYSITWNRTYILFLCIM